MDAKYISILRLRLRLRRLYFGHFCHRTREYMHIYKIKRIQIIWGDVSELFSREKISTLFSCNLGLNPNLRTGHAKNILCYCSCYLFYHSLPLQAWFLADEEWMCFTIVCCVITVNSLCVSMWMCVYLGVGYVTDGWVVRAGISVTWNVLLWSGGHEFELRSGRFLGAWCFCPSDPWTIK